MQDGLLEGLTIGGFVMHGHGTFQENDYLTGPNIQFTPSQIEELQGKSAYSVSLSSYERVVKLDNQGNLTSLYEELNVVSGDLNVISGDENVVTSITFPPAYRRLKGKRSFCSRLRWIRTGMLSSYPLQAARLIYPPVFSRLRK